MKAERAFRRRAELLERKQFEAEAKQYSQRLDAEQVRYREEDATPAHVIAQRERPWDGYGDRDPDGMPLERYFELCAAIGYGPNLANPCPECGAPIGRRCKTRTGNARGSPHKERPLP